MAEKIRANNESYRPPEAHRTYERRVEHRQAGGNTVHEHRQNIEQIIKKVETESVSARQLNEHAKASGHPSEQKPTQDHRFVGNEAKNSTLKRTLRSVQKDLRPYERPLSKFLHNTAVEHLSEAGGKTIGRPSGLLLGGAASFFISLAVLLACHYWGYEYNYFIGLASFPVGFAIGLIVEFISKPLRDRSR